MSSKTATAPKLKVKRLIKAPPERVFAAWTTPEEVVKWFGPETCRVTSAKIDLRVGGQYHFRVNSQEMGELNVRGVYREIKRPSKLVFTWKWKGAAEMEFPETIVTVEFGDAEGFTEVVLTHEGLPDKKSRESHSHGWNGTLDKLEKLVAAAGNGNNCPPVGSFSWNELVTGDMAASTTFYTKLFGWEAEASPVPNMKYTVFKKDGVMVGGCVQPQMENVPTHWVSYVTVEDVDASAKKATKLGGKVCVGAFDVPTIGRIAVMQDPQGAAFALFKPLKSC